MTHPFTVSLRIPFESPEHAIIARNSLSPDPILKPEEISNNFSTNECDLIVALSGISNRVIRVAISNIIDHLKTIVETIEEFGGDNKDRLIRV